LAETTSRPVAVPPAPAQVCRCGAGPHPVHARLCAAGHPRPGTQLAVMHALRTVDVPPEFVHLREEVTAFLEASLTDDGGADQTPMRRRSLHEYRARIHRRTLQLDAAIELRGLFDKRGKLRVAWLQQLQSLINTAKGIDQLLGLGRRAKRVPSLEDVLSGKVELR